MGIRVGDVVGPYKILQLLGRGSYSSVLLGQDPQHPSRRFALKVIACDHLDTNSAADAMKEAIAEAHLLQRLRHPNIVSCHQLCWDIERCAVWLALDFMDGGDLCSLIEGWRSFNSSVALNPGMYQASLLRRVVSGLCSALMYTHSHGILHRDVKPSNILLSRESKDIRLADFGISKILEATGHAHSTVGTPYYLSPEIVSGLPYGCPSDAWAVGVCIYELASLRRPFRAENQLALACQIAQQEPDPLPQGCAHDIAAIVVKLLAKSPEVRLTLKDALDMLEEPQLLSSSNVGSLRPSHCCAFGVLPVRSSRTRCSSLPNEMESPAVIDRKRSGARRRWLGLRTLSRSRLSKVNPTDHDFNDNTSKAGMKLVSCPCLAGHALQRTTVSDATGCGTCSERIPVDAAAWGCRTCSFRMCESCSRNEPQWKVLAVDDIGPST